MAHQNEEAKKLAVGSTEALLEMYADLRFSPAERRSFLDASWELWLRNRNQKRFLEKLQLFFDESEQQRKSAFKIGRYITEQLKK